MRRFLVLVVGLAALAACGAPDVPAYHDRTRQTVIEAAASVESARMALDLLGRDRAWSAYAQVVIDDSEQSLSTTAQTYAETEPPESADDLRSSTMGRLDAASAAVANARIAVSRGDSDRYRALTADLRDAARSLERERKALE